MNGATFLFPLHALTVCSDKNLPYHYGVYTAPGTYPELIGRKKWEGSSVGIATDYRLDGPGSNSVCLESLIGAVVSCTWLERSVRVNSRRTVWRKCSATFHLNYWGNSEERPTEYRRLCVWRTKLSHYSFPNSWMDTWKVSSTRAGCPNNPDWWATTTCLH